MKRMNWKRPGFSTLFPAAAAVLALAFGLIGVRWGLPALWYPDEPETLEQIVIPMARNLDLNPHVFNKGSLYYYFLLAVLSPYFAAIKLFRLSAADYEALVGRLGLISRVATACVGASGVVLMHSVAKRMTGSAAARLAALLLAVNVAYAAYSHFAYMEVPLLVMLLVCLLFGLRHLETRKTRDMALAAFFGGMAVSVKYNAALFAAVILLILLASMTAAAAKAAGTEGAGKGHPGLWLRRVPAAIPLRPALLCAGLAAAGFLLTTPFAVLDYRTFLDTLSRQSVIAKEGYKVFAGGSAWAGNFELLGVCFGPVLFPLVLAAWAGLLIRWMFKPSAVEALAVFPPLVYYLYIGTWRITAIRYVLAMVPFLILSAAILIDRLVLSRPSLKRPILTVAAAVLLFSAFGSCRNLLSFTADSRIRAEKWMADCMPAGSRIEAYSYKMYMPRIPSGLVSERINPDFVKDSPGLQEPMNGTADSSGSIPYGNRSAFTREGLRNRNPDYIILSSFYDDRYMPSAFNRTTELHPGLSRYYRELTDGSAGYGVAAVFSGRAMQEFYVNPTITILKRLE
jgi:hypothetical protein